MKLIRLRRHLAALLLCTLSVAPAVALAAGRAPWILVDTEALTLTVFSAEGRTLASFDNISIGSGGVARMHLRGDDTTPQGTFEVVLIDRNSHYGTFYGFAYPSAPIAHRAYMEGIISKREYDAIMAALRHKRMPPANTALGGRLGIHGLGSGDPRIHEAINWTDGCIALTKEQIRRLSRWMRLGSRVVIR
jgi:murein L,D-transpeptidase YafK